MNGVYEDTGYGGSGSGCPRVRTAVEIKRIRYLVGCDAGIVRRLNAEIADEMIGRGVAVEVGEREPGEDG
jgi:hypothetical protein